jgi:hypothetical protein
VLYNGCLLNEPEDVKKLYTRTHGHTDPGEQKDRNYNWPVNKTTYVFGKPQGIEMDGAKKSLRTDFLEADYPKTRVVEKRLEDFRQATSDMIGRSKFRGTLNPSLDDNHVYGKKSIIGDNWNASKCVHGDPEEKALKHLTPDPDLGKSILHRSKLSAVQPNIVPSDRVFGVPSVRVDLPQKKFTSINNNTVILIKFRIMEMKKMSLSYYTQTHMLFED